MNVQGNSVTFGHCSTVDGATSNVISGKKSESAPMLREERALWCNNSCTTLSATTLTCDIENTALDAFASASSTTGSMKLCQVNFFSSMRDNVKHQQIMAKSCILNTYISATDADEILYVFIPVHPMTDV